MARSLAPIARTPGSSMTLLIALGLGQSPYNSSVMKEWAYGAKVTYDPDMEMSYFVATIIEWFDRCGRSLRQIVSLLVQDVIVRAVCLLTGHCRRKIPMLCRICCRMVSRCGAEAKPTNL